MHSSYLLVVAAAASILAAPHDVGSELSSRAQYKSSDGMIVNIDTAPSGTDKRSTLSTRQTVTTSNGMVVTIEDAPPGITERKRSPLEKRNSDYVSSCGPRSGWIPIADQQQSNGAWWWGYQNAVTGFCNGISADFDGNPFIIGPGKLLSTTRRYEFELSHNGRQIALKGFVPGHIEFEIHNKQEKGDHVPDKDKCISYLMKMTDPKANGSNCYGSNNKDTKGGTWQIGNDQVSYHALPAKD